MRRTIRAAGAAALLCLPVAPLSAQEQAGAAVPASDPTPAANLAALQPCAARAARYEGAKGFAVFATQLGEASVANPLRPLTPEVTQVLQVTIAGKAATAYGPDLTALRRGAAPAALEALLGAPVRWSPSLPVLPDPLTIVGEDGAPLATLAFRECTDPPAVKAAPAVARKDGNVPRAPKPARAAAAPKVPPGFQVPQGAITE